MMNCELLKSKYGVNVPIFTEEILDSFPDFSRAQVFRFIKKSKEKGELLQYDNGVYYIPTQTVWGKSTISADTVIEKKYLQNDDNTFGLYSGIKLFNFFAITTQMAATVEIVTNNESARYREIQLKNRRFILRRSRCKIDNDNIAAYTILQLFSELNKNDVIDDNAKARILAYIAATGVTKEQLFALSMKFPSRATQYLAGSGILNEIA